MPHIKWMKYLHKLSLSTSLPFLFFTVWIFKFELFIGGRSRIKSVKDGPSLPFWAFLVEWVGGWVKDLKFCDHPVNFWGEGGVRFFGPIFSWLGGWLGEGPSFTDLILERPLAVKILRFIFWALHQQTYALSAVFLIWLMLVVWWL